MITRLLTLFGAVLALSFGALPASAGGYHDFVVDAPAYDQAADDGGSFQVAELAVTTSGPLTIKSGKGVGGGGGGSSAPTLAANNGAPFGKWTAAGKGSPLLDSTSLGLVASVGSSAITDWDITVKSGSCANPSQWQGTGTGLAAASNPRLPTLAVSSTVTTPCTWNIVARNAVGLSNTMEWTYTPDPCAIGLGDDQGGSGDSNDTGAMGVSVTTFAAISSGTCPELKMLVHVGTQRQTSGYVLNGFAFTREVVMQYADPARPSTIRRIQSTSATPFLSFRGMTLDGPSPALPGNEGEGRLAVGGSDSNITAMQIGTASNAAGYNINYWGVHITGDRVTASGNKVIYHARGFNVDDIADNVTICGNAVEKWHRNGVFIGSSQTALICRNYIGPNNVYLGETPGAIHPDCMQIRDGSTSNNVTIAENFCDPFDESSASQALQVGGGQNCNLVVAGNIMPTNLYSGITIGGNCGASAIEDNANFKAVVGVYDTGDYQPIVGLGPWINAVKATCCTWTGTMSIARNFTEDEVQPPEWTAEQVGTSPTIGVGANANLECFNTGGCPAGFVNGSPRANMEAFSKSTWWAMSYTARVNQAKQWVCRADSVGPVDATCNWKRSYSYTLP